MNPSSKRRIVQAGMLLAAVAAAGAAFWLERDRPSDDRSGERYVEQRGGGGVESASPARPAPDQEPLRYDTEYPTMRYATAPRSDAIAKLEAKLASGEAKLTPGPRGYLDSLLAALEVDPSSQTLVFSQTSLQSRRIRPETPRAIYFNDDVYVAWVQQGPIEIGAMDPNLGPVFYLLEQPAGESGGETAAAARAGDTPRFDRELTRCLSCHDSYSLTGGGVPRFIVGSGYIGASGELVSHEGWILVTDKTPIKSRWGGWYVTGDHGDQVHLGNMLIRSMEDFQRLEELRVNNIETLDTLFDTTPYATNKSDVVALMILEHQVNAQNALARANYDVRTAIDRERGAERAAEGYEQPLAELSADVRAAVEAAVEPLVATLTFADEIGLTAPLTGDPAFTEQFASRAVRDPNGRALRDLDMQTRMFRYPLSYLVHSAAFDALPRAAREAAYARVAAILTSADPGDAYALAGAADRAAALEILTATKPAFAAFAK